MHWRKHTCEEENLTNDWSSLTLNKNVGENWIVQE